MARALLILVLLIACFNSNAQSNTDTISIRKQGLSYRFKDNGRLLNPKMVTKILKKDPDASKLMSKSNNLFVVTSVCAGVGGGLIGSELGRSLGGSKIDPAIIGAGAAFIALAFNFQFRAFKAEARAVKRYNRDVLKTTFHGIRPDYYLTATGNGLGLVMRF